MGKDGFNDLLAPSVERVSFRRRDGFDPFRFRALAR
jgi:hypothetical protein